MLNLNTNNSFARVHNNQILEWPISYDSIQKENWPIHLFKIIHYNPKPEHPGFSDLVESIELINGTPTVSYTVLPWGFQKIFDFVSKNKTEEKMVACDVLAMNYLFSLIRTKAQENLDAFAATRGYSGINTLVTYKDDPDPQHSLEGWCGIVFRSQYWIAVAKLEKDLLSGKKPLPVSEKELFSFLPELTWE